MRLLLLWLVVGAALVGYLSLAWGRPGRDDEPTPEPADLLGGPALVSPVARPPQPPATPTPGPTLTPLPAGSLAASGDPFVLASAGRVTGGARVDLSGQGFRPGEALVVVLRGSGLRADREVFRGFAGREGQLEAVGFSVPTDLSPGRYVVRVAAVKGGRSGETEVQVVGGQPGAEPDVWAAQPGGRVAFRGGGFQPGERVDVFFDTLDSDPLGTVQAGPAGEIALAGPRVPLSPEGQHAFVLLGEQSRVPVRVPFTVTGFTPWLVLDSYTPLPQQSIGLTGEDFYPGERVRVYLGEVGPAPATVLIASESGQVAATGAVPVPVDLRGTSQLVAIGEQSGAVASAEVTVQEFSPALELTLYAGPPGSSVAFIGSAFAASEVVHAYVGGASDRREVAAFETGLNGAFRGAGAFRLPPETPAGRLTLTVVGELSRAPVSLVFHVLPLTPWVGLDPYSGPAGTPVAVVGGGFAPGETVEVRLGDARGQPILAGSADVDGKLGPVGPVTVPPGSGRLVFALVGEASRATASAEFTVLEPPVEATGEAAAP